MKNKPSPRGGRRRNAGRKPLPARACIQMRVHPDEKQMMQDAADRQGVSLTAWILAGARKRLLLEGMK